jgi:hypothetical protein
MVSPTDASPALWQLSVSYAAAADARDRDAFAGLFDEHVCLVLSGLPGMAAEETRTIEGASGAGQVIDALTQYSKTFHLLGQAEYHVDGSTATGTVYCVAHHYMRDRLENAVMYIRYEDDYRLAAAEPACWKISRRHVLVQWTETRPTGQLGGRTT